MADFCGEPGALLEKLKREPELEGIRLTEEYPAENKPCPLKKPVIALGLHSLTVAPVCAGKKLGWDGESFCEGRRTKTALQAEVCTPLLLGGEKCREVLVKLLRAVCACGAQVGEIRCGSIRADRNAGAYVMDAVMELRGFYVSDRRQGITVAAVARGEALE